jgi:DNA invertase Pin-like site-specific DNA recombinase
MTAYIGYIRVSTEGQGKSGLGMEAQVAAIHRHIRAEDKLLMPIMEEVESGKRSDRPVLRKALDRCLPRRARRCHRQGGRCASNLRTKDGMTR